MTQSVLQEGVALRRLVDVASLVDSGIREFRGKKRYVKTGDVLNNEIMATQDVTYRSRPSRANMEVQEGDVICARMKATVKVLLITSKERDYLFSTGFAILRPKLDAVSPEYLMYYLRSNYFQAEKDKLAQGATQKAVNNSALQELRVPVPPLETQKRVIAVLDRSERINHEREHASELTDKTAQSLFVDMFGDPVTNPKGWNTDILEKVCDEIYRYPTFYGFQYKPKGVPVMRIGNIQDDGTVNENLSDYVFIDEQISSRFPRTILEYNDILMAVRGDGSTGKIGHVSTEKLVGANISPNLIRIHADSNRIHPLYLFHLLYSKRGQGLIRSRITRTAKKKITAVEFKAIAMPVPPMELQNKFAHMIESLARIKRMQIEFSAEANNLFLSLMQKAFGGERIPAKIATET
jgi:type I restriction enzyme S subunit